MCKILGQIYTSGWWLPWQLQLPLPSQYSMPCKPHTLPTNWLSWLLLAWMTFMPLSFSAGAGYFISTQLDRITYFTPYNWVLVYAIAVVTMGFALTPTTIIALLSGYFIGLYSIVPVIISYSLASIIGYGLARLAGKNFQKVIAVSYPRLNNFLNQLTSKSPYQFVVFSRISPVLPFAVMNLVLPLAGVKFRPFFWGGMVGMLPRTLVAIAAGKLAKDVVTLVQNPGQSSMMQLGFAVLLLISFAGFIYMYKQFGKQNTPMP